MTNLRLCSCLVLFFCLLFLSPTESEGREKVSTDASKSAQTKPIRVVLVDGGFPPFYFAKESSRKGIYQLVLESLEEVSDLRFTFHYVSQKRKYLEFERRNVDLEPGVNPGIRKPWAHISAYSQPFAQVSDVIVAHGDDKIQFKKPADLKGKTLGGMSGYNYPEFSSLFASGDLRRDDSPSEINMLRKVSKERIDAGILFGPVARFYMKEDKSLKVRVAGELVKRPMQMRLHKDLSALIPKFNTALDALQERGAVQKIFDQFQ